LAENINGEKDRSEPFVSQTFLIPLISLCFIFKAPPLEPVQIRAKAQPAAIDALKSMKWNRS
jgi:hypothetical protein